MNTTTERSLLTPATCFTIACVAFSFIAVSAVWRNQTHTSKSNSRAIEAVLHERPRLRPHPTRRVAVDSLYADSGDALYLNAAQNPGDQTVSAPVKALSGLIDLSASLAEQLRSNPRASESRLTNVSLLGELSLITTSLCRLQQQLVSNVPWFTQGSGVAACFSATISGLNETLLLLQSELCGHGRRDEDAIHLILQQLRDQRPSLQFLLESSSAQSLPPTPPADEEMDRSLKPPNSPGKNSLPAPMPTGLTPAIEFEPPPEYTPPHPGSVHAAVAEKSDVKATQQPPETQDEASAANSSDGCLYNAVTDDDSELVLKLLSRGEDPNQVYGDLQRTPLHQAAHLNHCACVSSLLRNGSTMSTGDAKGDTPLHLAAWAGHVEALSTLLAYGADVDWLSGRDGYSPLWCAISAYHIDAARLLLKHGARVSLRSASGGGLMPLHQAAVTGQSAMCELLLERGAQVDCLDEDSNTPLHYAAASGSGPSVRVLLKGRAQVDVEQAQGLTPGHWASHKGHADVLAMLIAYGGSVNATAEDGATPLHLAANRGHLATVRLLLEKGARRKSKAVWDGVEGTPADMARTKGHARVANVIESWRKS